MPQVITIKMEGLRQLGENFRALSYDMQKKALKIAGSAGAEIIAAQARINAPKKTGQLRRAIGARRSAKESGPGLEIWMVGVFGDKGYVKIRGQGGTYETAPPSRYWRFLEYGWVSKPEGAPFLRPALDTSRVTAQNKIRDRLAERIAAFAVKLKTS